MAYADSKRSSSNGKNYQIMRKPFIRPNEEAFMNSKANTKMTIKQKVRFRWISHNIMSKSSTLLHPKISISSKKNSNRKLYIKEGGRKHRDRMKIVVRNKKESSATR